MKPQKNSLKAYLRKLNMKIFYFSLHKRDWNNFEQNDKSIALNILFSSKDSEEITLLYKSK